MKKRFIAISLSFALTAALVTGCGKDTPKTDSQSKESVQLPDNYVPTEELSMGVTVMLPEEMVEDGTLIMQDPWIMFGDLTQEPVVTETTPDQNVICYYLSLEGEFPLFGLMRYDEAKWDKWMEDGKKPSDITGEEKTTEIGRKDGLIYVFTEPGADVSSLTEEQQKGYEELVGQLPAIRDSVQISLGAESDLPPLSDFSVATLGGGSADASIFSGHKLTMVNVWGTFCGPCIEEMPMLQQMSQEMPEGTQLIGIVGDIYEGDTVTADQILLNTGVTYPNLIAEGELLDYVMQNIVAYPTTFFVDENGNVIGEAVIGAREQSVYEAIVNERLKMLGK